MSLAATTATEMSAGCTKPKVSQATRDLLTANAMAACTDAVAMAASGCKPDSWKLIATAKTPFVAVGVGEGEGVSDADGLGVAELVLLTLGVGVGVGDRLDVGDTVRLPMGLSGGVEVVEMVDELVFESVEEGE